MAFTSEKIAVLAPIPSASESSAIEVKRGDLRNWRKPKRRSCPRYSAKRSPAIAAIFFYLFHAAKLEACEATSFAFGNAGTHRFGDLRLEMEAQLFFEIGLQSPASENPGEPAHNSPSSVPFRMRPTTSVRRLQLSVSAFRWVRPTAVSS